MATIKFIIQSKTVQSAIYLRLSLNRKEVFKRKTGLDIDFKQWSKDKGLPKQTVAENKKLTSKLKALELRIIEDLNEANTNGSTVNGEWLKFRIDLFFQRTTENEKSDLLIDCIQDIIDNAETHKNSKGGIGISKSRIKNYIQLRNLISVFSKSNTHKVKDVDLAFSKSFLNWLLKTKKYNKGFALKAIDDLRAVCNEASTQGIETNPQLQNVKGGRVKNEFIIYLTNEELDKIEQADITKESLINTRKWLLLGCNIGQRGGDLLNITESNFKTVGNLSVIELEQQKTEKVILIPVNQKVRDIINNGLPYKISMPKFNEHLKSLCKECEIDTPTKGSVYKKTNEGKRKVEDTYPKHELITSHCCRRSFCSNYYGKMPTNLIMQISGHSTEKMLLTYIGKKSADYLQEIAHYFALEEQRNLKKTNLIVVKKTINQ